VVVTSADPASRLTQLSGNRYALWRAAVQGFDARPFSGTGAGTFEFCWDRRGTNSEFVRNAHSLELENLSELGLPGLLLIVGVLAAGVAVLAAARRGARRRTSAGAAAGALAMFTVYIAQASVDWLWQSTAVTVFALAVLAALGVRQARPRPRVRWFGRVAVVALALAGLATQLPGLLAADAVTRSQAAERAGHAAQALAWAGAAVSAEPWSASAYDQRGLVLESGRQLRPAAADYRRAVALEPTNFRHWLLLARVETEAGELGPAQAAYEHAQRLRAYGLAYAVPGVRVNG
jgi:tetratricopeptide (TPR) repeat protein